jgi:hypothetical protein
MPSWPHFCSLLLIIWLVNLISSPLLFFFLIVFFSGNSFALLFFSIQLRPSSLFNEILLMFSFIIITFIIIAHRFFSSSSLPPPPTRPYTNPAPLPLFQAIFRKHGRRGAPHDRKVTLEKNGIVHYTSGLVPLAEVTRIVRGKTTDVFARATQVSPDVCFSLIAPSRTLDLEAPSMAVRDTWVP